MRTGKSHPLLRKEFFLDGEIASARIYACSCSAHLRHGPGPGERVDYIHAQDDGSRLWNKGFHFGDWLALDGPDPFSPMGVAGTYLVPLCTGSVDVDSTMKKFESELKASGVDKVIAEMQMQYDAWRAKNGK